MPASLTRREALCEQGLTHRPGDPMLHHLLAAVLFSKGEIETARSHIKTSLAKRPDNAAAQLLAARVARAAGDFGAALSHLDRVIAIAPQREAFLEKARTLDQAALRQADLRPQAREAWRAILEVIPGHPEAAARLGRFGMRGWRPRSRGDAARTRRDKRGASVGLVRSRPRPPGFARSSTAPSPPIARRSNSSPIMRKPRSISVSCCRNPAISMAPCAPTRKPIACVRRASAPSRWR